MTAERRPPWLAELGLVLKLLAIAGVISAGIKGLGARLTLATPPIWVPLAVVGGTMAGTVGLLVWLAGRDSRRSATPDNLAADGGHRSLPPPETGD